MMMMMRKLVEYELKVI